jgi:hypothetical protein
MSRMTEMGTASSRAGFEEGRWKHAPQSPGDDSLAKSACAIVHQWPNTIWSDRPATTPAVHRKDPRMPPMVRLFRTARHHQNVAALAALQ